MNPGRRDENGWETRSTTIRYADDHLAIVTETVKTPSVSEPKPWTTVQRKAAVVIAPLLADGKFLLIREERVPIRETIWSMPAGQIDGEKDSIEDTALRELREETGYKLAANGELVGLGHFFTSPGLTNECCHLFLARHVERTSTPQDDSIVECRAFSPMDLTRMIAENEIRDSNTLSICAHMAARGFLSFQTQP